MEPRHAEVVVKLTGTDGNAFAILGAVQRAMRRAGLPESEIAAYREAATAGDYDNLLATTMRWVTVE